jgi:hypothetical protein
MGLPGLCSIVAAPARGPNPFPFPFRSRARSLPRGGFLSHRLNGFLRGQRGKVFRKVPELSAEAIALRSR